MISILIEPPSLNVQFYRNGNERLPLWFTYKMNLRVT